MRKCFYCNRSANTVDHVIPRSKGGKNKPENKVPACQLCNTTKSNMDALDFMAFMDWQRREGYNFKEMSRSRRKDLKDTYYQLTGVKIGPEMGDCKNCKIKQGAIIHLDTDGKCIKCGKTVGIAIKPTKQNYETKTVHRNRNTPYEMLPLP